MNPSTKHSDDSENHPYPKSESKRDPLTHGRSGGGGLHSCWEIDIEFCPRATKINDFRIVKSVSSSCLVRGVFYEPKFRSASSINRLKFGDRHSLCRSEKALSINIKDVVF